MFGVLPVDKPRGWTSRKVCNFIDNLAKPEKIGHTGTLDPLATGVLLIAVGRASRLVEFSLGHSKTYVAEFAMGLSSDTLDSEGQVDRVADAPVPDRQSLLNELQKWIGQVEQVPPKFSAINVGGRRAYDLARKGKGFELPPRRIEIHSIDLLEFTYPRIVVRVECGSGTYIRSLGSDVARGLGSDAIMTALQRTRVGPFSLEQCVAPNALTERNDVANHLHPPQTLLANMPFVRLDATQTQDIRHGIPILMQHEARRLAGLDLQENLVAVLERVPQTGTGQPPNGDSRYRSLRVFQIENETNQPANSNAPHSAES